MARRRATRTESEVPAIDIVSRIQRVESELSPAERQVAAAVQLDFEAATRLTIAELAAKAGVSQPTVTRFCRSVGCSSFNDFKIRLASTMTVAAVYLRSDRVFSDDIGQLAQSVMLRAANAVRACLDQLDTASVGRAILGIPVSAYTDGHQQRMSASTLQPGDVVFAISNSGRSKAVVEAVQIAASFGATTIALTRPNTPLAKAAAIVIPIVIPEDDNVLVPTASRYAHMAVIDTIASGVAQKLGARGREALRRVRYTLTSIGVAIPTPSTDPTKLMQTLKPHE
jgi:RpiR family transcriptional regulator, carbohydrate utilization regulator